MLFTAVLLFIIAVLFEVRLLLSVFQNRSTTKLAVVLHGVFALSGLTLLIAYIILSDSNKSLILSTTLFILAAFGGLTMLSMDLRKKPISKLIATFHPLLAITALVLLIGYATH